MDGYLGKTLRICLFLGLGLGIGAFLYAVGAAYYTQYDSNRALIQRLITTKSTDCLVLGNSHASIAAPKILGCPKGERLNSGGTDLSELLYQVKYLAPRLPKLNTVFISMSYFTLHINNGAFRNPFGTRTRREKRLRLYAAYNTLQVIDGNLSDFVMGKLYPLFTQDHWRKILDPKKEPQTKKTRKPTGKKQISREEKISNLDIHAHQRCRTVYKDMVPNMARNYHGDIVQNNKSLLFSIVETLQAQGIRVVFFTPPYWPAYLKQTPPEFIAGTRGAMKELQERYGIEYYDFSDDDYFRKHPEFYVNSDHLNVKNLGAVKAFNQRLRKIME